ncbi:hypothetical protein B0H17DRAFT_1208457 [Mycena rosella]|uniref:Uncharacterized protein n=1 Tax=Mycena rosella TaxID=1033263 RepID=A0AAD7D114_MYCRO|nr:hypothetical protein B0H17DRAFT_1208457 [Mycena rosella]
MRSCAQCSLLQRVTTLSSGAFFAALRLVLHAQAGRGIDRGLAFVQAAPIPLGAPTNPFLPTPASSPEARARPSLPPRKPISPAPRKIGATASSESSLSRLRRAPRPRHCEGHTMYILPRSPSPAPRHTRYFPRRRTPCAAPRRSARPLISPHIRHFADPAPHRAAEPRARILKFKRNHGPSPNSHSKPKPVPPDPAPAARLLSVPTSPAPPPAPFPYPTSAGPRSTSFAQHPPVHPQRRASAFEAVYGAPASPSFTTHTAHDGQRVASASSASDSARRSSNSAPTRRPSSSPDAFTRERTSSIALPLTLPLTLRRTLAGAG